MPGEKLFCLEQCFLTSQQPEGVCTHPLVTALDDREEVEPKLEPIALWKGEPMALAGKQRQEKLWSGRAAQSGDGAPHRTDRSTAVPSARAVAPMMRRQRF